MTLALFAPSASRGFAQDVAAKLRIAVGALEERSFEDGEHKSRPLESVRGRDVFVLHSLYGDREESANDKLVRLLLLIGTLKDAGAERVTSVVPYLCYARKDRRTKSRDPVSTRHVARLFEAVGTDRIVTVDVHNLAAFENAFRIPTEHLEARGPLVEHLASRIEGSRSEITVLSPDIGGIKRADAFRMSLERRIHAEVESAFMEKYRSAGVVSGEQLVGPVSGRVVLLVDDLVSSGTTLSRAARACRAEGATAVLAVATHGAFAREAPRVLEHAALDALIVTDTIDAGRKGCAPEQMEIVSTTGLVAEAIRRLHEGGSVSALSE